MKNFDFAPNVVRTSYRSSFFGDNYGSEFCFGPSFFICWWIFRILSCKRCILFNKNAPLWIELSVSLWGYLFPWYFLVEITILFHGRFGPGFHAGLSTSLFAPSLPVGFLERLTYCLLTSSFAAASLDAILASAAFFDDRFDVFCCSVSSCRWSPAWMLNGN